MSDDIGYTIAVVYDWSKYGEGLKNIFKKYGVKWNSDKMEKLNEEESKEILIKYKVGNDFNCSVSIGKSGIWESKNCAIKIIMEDEKGGGSDIGLLVYRKRSLEDKLWSIFVKYCKDCGALVQVLDENREVVFRDRINVELIKRINDKVDEKKVMTENFIEKCQIEEYLYGDSFKEKWVRCIKNEP